MRFSFAAEVWEHEGTMAGWFFISLPEDVADEIEGPAEQQQRGFGSVRVDVTIGGTRWQTSVFPDRKLGTYVLPVKKPVRVAEQLEAGSTANVELTVVDVSR